VGPDGEPLPAGTSLRDLEKRDKLRARFDQGLQALDSIDVMTGLDGFHRVALEILRSDRVRAALDLARESDRLRDDACSPDDLAATIFQRLGISPHHEVPSASGRPIAIFREGKCLAPLLA
jgi:hypothetical protein